MPRLPVRITPHALLETLVEVHYTPRTYPEVALGAFFYAVRPEYRYERPLPQALETVPPLMQAPAEPTFQNQDICFRIRPTSINFSWRGDYPGWERYFRLIQDVLTRLHGTGEITNFPRVGVRYINALPWGPLNRQLQMGLPDLGNLPPPDSTVYQAAFTTDAFRIILNLADNQLLEGREGRYALFDIDVISEHPTLADLPGLFTQIDQAHTREKEVFFGLLSEAFLKTLQPEYAPGT